MNVAGTLRREVTGLLGDGKGKLLVPIAGGWGTLLGVRMIYPILLPYIRDTFTFGLTTAGLLVTVLWLGSAVGQLPGGMLADRYSERTLMVGATAVVAAALAVVITAPSPIVLFAATAVVGLGQSLYPVARITMLSRLYPSRIGSALGVTMGTGDLGQTVFPPIAGVLAAAVSWHLGLGFMVPLLILVGVLLWVFLPGGEPSADANESATSDSLRSVVGQLWGRRIGFVTFVLFLYILVWQSFTGLYPTYLVEMKDFSSAEASLLFGLFFAAGIVVKPLAGAVYDRIGMRNALLLFLVGPIGGLSVLPFVGGFLPIGLLTVVVSSMLGAGTITQSYLSDVIPDDVQGTGLGAVRTTAATLGAAGPVVFGVAADAGYFDEGYLLLAAVLAVVVALIFLLSDP